MSAPAPPTEDLELGRAVINDERETEPRHNGAGGGPPSSPPPAPRRGYGRGQNPDGAARTIWAGLLIIAVGAILLMVGQMVAARGLERLEH